MSIGDMLERLLTDRLIDACHMTSELVTIVQGGKRHRFPHRKAHAFLLGMLRGRSWNDGRPFASVHGDGAPPRATDTMRETDRPKTYPLEPALGEMLRIATRMDIIKESKYDSESGVVTISLSACETAMGESEALAFLAECILHKLNELRRMPESPSAEVTWKGGIK